MSFAFSCTFGAAAWLTRDPTVPLAMSLIMLLVTFIVLLLRWQYKDS